MNDTIISNKWQVNSKQAEVRYVVRSVEANGTRWKVINKKALLDLNPHDVVEAYEIGKPVKLTINVQ